MAHFEKPQWAPAGDYDVDNKVAPGSISVVRIPLGKRRSIALSGGKDLWIRSTDANVVPGNDLQEQPLGKYRIFNLLGRTSGICRIETGQGTSVWTRVQVQVGTVKVAAVPARARFVLPDNMPRGAGRFNAAGDLWRIELEQKSTIEVGLENGAGLVVTSNSPTRADIHGEYNFGRLRMFRITGTQLGNTMIEARNASGTVVAYIQLEVVPATAVYGPIARGEGAARMIVKIINTMGPSIGRPVRFESQWGTVEIKSGMVWGSDKMIVYADTQYVCFTTEDVLYKIPTNDFVRSRWFDEIAKAAIRSEGMVTLAQVEMQLVQGILAGPSHIIIAYSIVAGVWYFEHPTQRALLWKAGKRAMAALYAIRSRYPLLWDKLMLSIATYIKNSIVEALAQDLTNPKTILFFIGRLIRGAATKEFQKIGLTKFKKKPFELTFKVFLKIVATTAAVIAGLHFVPNMITVTEKSLSKLKPLADQLAAEFAKPGIGMNLSDSEAMAIARELAKHSDTQAILEELSSSLNELLPILDEFSKEMEKVHPF